MRIDALRNLHRAVVHGGMLHSEACQTYDIGHPDQKRPKYLTNICEVCAEEVWIKKMQYNALDLICKDCFTNPS